MRLGHTLETAGHRIAEHGAGWTGSSPVPRASWTSRDRPDVAEPSVG